MSEKRVREADRPNREGGYYPIVSPGMGQTVRGAIVHAKVYGVYTHFVESIRRTQPCIEPAEECPGCQRKLKRRWKGYLGVVLSGTGKYGIAELTSGAVEDCQELLNGDLD